MGRMHAPKTGPQWRRGRESSFLHTVEDEEAIKGVWIFSLMDKDDRG